MVDVQSTVRYRPVKGFRRYKVGDDGSAWRVKKDGIWRKLKQTKTATGYVRYGLHQHKKTTYIYGHRLVLEAFVGPCPPGMECRHLDGDPGNNRLTNLAWGTPKDNAADKVKHGTINVGKSYNRGTDHPTVVLDEERVRRIRKSLADGTTQAEVARSEGVSYGCIADIRHGRSWAWLDNQ